MDKLAEFKFFYPLPKHLWEQWPKATYFKPFEFINSRTADTLGIVNTPDDDAIWLNLINIINYVLIPVRKRINMPIIISSGYRSPSLNLAVKGAKHSYHMFGRAVDIYCANNKTLDDAILAVNNANLKAHRPVLKEFIRYKNFIHIAL